MDIREQQHKTISEGIVEIQNEDLQSVLDTLGITPEEAIDRIQVIHYRGTNVDIEYKIIDKNTLQEYFHRKIDIGLFGGVGK